MSDRRDADGTGRVGTWQAAGVFGLIFALGINLRTVLLGVPPVLPLIQRDLGLSHTGTGLLTALPVLVMGGAALPSGLLAGRLGGRSTVALGLVLLGAGAVLRALWPAALALYLFTGLLSLGIALAQTAMPVLVRLWYPARIGLASALFTDGIIAGETIAAALTAPVLLRWLGPDAWRGTFVVWGLPVLLMAALWLRLAPAAGSTTASSTIAAAGPRPPASATAPPAEERWIRASGSHATARQPAAAVVAAGVRAKGPNWLACRIGLLTGSGGLIYFGMNAWIAPYNAAIGHAAVTPLALTALNAAQLPVSTGLTLVAQTLAGRRWPFAVAGAICLASIIAWGTTSSVWEPLWAALMGGSGAAVLLLGIALPPLLATRESVARLAGSVLTLNYTVAFLGPLAGGRLWDLSGRPILAFLPVGVASLALILLAALLPGSGPRTE